MKWRGLIAVCVVLPAAGGMLSMLQHRRAFTVSKLTSIPRGPNLRPDYSGSVIPPNLAPINFRVEEPGTHYRVTVHSTRGRAITVRSRSPKIVFPLDQWQELLGANRGEDLLCEVLVRQQDGRWHGFEAITGTIAREDIDPYLVYRKIRPLYNYWSEVGIYQRHLGTYDESVVLSYGKYPVEPSGACINCHSFANNRADRMSIGVRAGAHGSSTPLVLDGAVTKIDTKFGYTSWHPSGRMVAYSLNKVRQFFHAGGTEVRDVIDLDSDLAYYEVGSGKVKTTAAISDPERLETYPTWSPDGRFLYFCSARIPWSSVGSIPPENYEEVRYDLLRIAYDQDTDTWGKVQTVLDSTETGLSNLLPRISPDGKFLLFCMCEYGCFPIFQPSSDLYLMDLSSGEHRRLNINSERSESWHSWSSNSRWFVFSSKRRDGTFTRSYFSYLDAGGRAHKPLLLPQRDPAFYDSHLKTYSVPELLVEPVPVSPEALRRAIESPKKVQVTLPDMSMTRKPPGGPTWRPTFPERE